MNKKLKTETVSFLEFSNDDMKELGMKEGDKFSIDYKEDGSILLKPFVTMPIVLRGEDMTDAEYINLLELLINKSVDDDVSVNEVIAAALEYTIDKFQRDKRIRKEHADEDFEDDDDDVFKQILRDIE